MSSKQTTGSARDIHTSVSARADISELQQSILHRNAHIKTTLGSLKPAAGSKKPERRVGRGIGSGRGKTSTYGHKGRTARQGGEVAFGFEGGQTPYYKRLRKYGFTNKAHKIEYAPLNLSRLQFWIDTGRIDPTQKITIKTLQDSGCVGRLRKLQKGIKLLGEGHDWFKTPIDIEVSQASTTALNAVQQTGGKIKLVYYNDTGMRALLHPEKYQPHTARRLPYLTIPRVKINRKLLHPMEQPEQFSGWVESQAALREAIEFSNNSADPKTL
jgi:large subunit ribosomal protein L15